LVSKETSPNSFLNFPKNNLVKKLNIPLTLIKLFSIDFLEILTLYILIKKWLLWEGLIDRFFMVYVSTEFQPKWWPRLFVKEIRIRLKLSRLDSPRVSILEKLWSILFGEEMELLFFLLKLKRDKKKSYKVLLS
jgi:hypothetical protein